MTSKSLEEIEQEAAELFGSELAARWLQKPLMQLDGRSAKEAFERGEGERVEELLMRSRHGFVF